MKNKKKIELNQYDPVNLFNKSWVLRVLLHQKRIHTVLSTILVFIIIYSVGLYVNYHEGSLVISDGNVSYYSKISNEHFEDTVFVNKGLILYLKGMIDNPKTTKLDIFLDDTQKGHSKEEVSNVTLLQTKPGEYTGQTEGFIIGRKYSISLDEKQKNVFIQASFNGQGYLEDYANYLYFFALILSIILFRILLDKYLFAFTGNKYSKYSRDNYKQIHWHKGLLKIIKFAEEDQREYFAKMNKYLSIISFKTNCKFKKNLTVSSVEEEKLNYEIQLPLKKCPKFWYYVIFAIYVVLVALMERYSIIKPGSIQGHWNFSPDIYPMGYWFNQLKDLLIWVIIMPPVIVRVLFIAWSTIKLVGFFDARELFNIKPISADKAGGLSPLGEVTLLLFYITIAFLPHFFATSIILGYPLTHKILYPIYFLGTFYLFFFPLNAPHNSMKAAKHKELGDVARKYHEIYNRFKGLKKTEKNERKETLEEMEDINRVYERIEKMPVWPFDFGIFIKFGAVFFTGFGVYLIQLILSLFKIGLK